MRSFPREVRRKVHGLNHSKRLLFAALCCEKLYQNYKIFVEKEGWGELDDFQEAVNVLFMSSVKPDFYNKEDIVYHLFKIDEVMLNLEGFSGNLTSYALDACAAVYDALDYLIDSDYEKIVNVSAYSIDTVDLFIQMKNDMDPNDADLEEKIASDSFMMNEIYRQRELLRRIKELEKINDQSLAELSKFNQEHSFIDFNLRRL